MFKWTAAILLKKIKSETLRDYINRDRPALNNDDIAVYLNILNNF